MLSTAALAYDVNDPLTVHFIIHSHMDVGWLHSYDWLYGKWARDIFGGVIKQLEKHPDLTYTVGDLAYFSRYLREQDDARQKQIK